MHNVMDPQDTVPDEAEQLRLSGYPVGYLEREAREAGRVGDLDRLAGIRDELGSLKRDPSWPYDEPEDDASLHALLAAAPRFDVPHRHLADRLHGAWLGRTVGNTLGKPVEGLSRGEIEIYLRAAGQWPQTGYLPLLDPLPDGVSALHPSAPIAAAGRFTDVPRDDDIDWTILNLHLLEVYGHRLTTEQVAAGWLDLVPFTQTYTAERAAYRNLVQGHRPPCTATRDNPYREWIGALIRADAFGYVCPGNLREAARLALVDARLSHVLNGMYGEMWGAALISAAVCVDTAVEALDAALTVVPPRSRLADALQSVAGLHRDGATATQALDHVDATLGDYPWVHSVNNAALIAIGLLWGDDFMGAVGLTLSGGRDTDSNGATVGSVLGALRGAAGIPAELVGTTHVHVRSAVRDFDWIEIDDLAQRTLRLTKHD